MWVCFCSDSVNRCCDTSCFFSPLERLGFGLVVRFFFLCVLLKVLIIHWPLLRTAPPPPYHGGVCRVSVPCGAALLLLPALDICCHSRTCGWLACTLRGPYVCFVPRDVVSVDGLAQCAHTLPLVASHAQLQVTDGLVYIDELFTKRYFSSLFLSRRAQCRDNASRSVGQWRWRWRR